MIALYPGAFKPPHRGHFEVVKSLLNGNHGGKVYDIDSYAEAGMGALKGQPDKLQPINKVLLFIGGGVRNGITKEESMAVWKVYAKYLPGLQIMDGEKNPMFAAKDYAKANPQDNFYAITGIRAEEDLPDLRRVTTFKNRENVEGLVIPAGAGSNVRATDFRNAILSGNLDDVLDFFPGELSNDEILKIMSMLKASIIAEIMQEDLENKLNEMFEADKEVKKEGSSGTAIAPQSVTRSADRAKLVTLYNRLRNVIGDQYYDIGFHQDHIIIRNKNEEEYIGEVVQVTVEGEICRFYPDEYDILSDEALQVLYDEEGYHVIIENETMLSLPSIKDRMFYLQSRGISKRMALKWSAKGMKDMVYFKPYFELIDLFARTILPDSFYTEVEGIKFN